MFRRVEIESHDDFQFFRKPGILADLEGLHQMRLQAVGMPDTPYGGFAQSRRRRHRARAPVRGIERLLLRGFVNHFGGAGLGDCTRPAGSRRIFFECVDSTIQITVAPSRGLLRRDPQLRCDLLILQASGGSQHNPRSLHQTRRQRTSPRQLLQRSLSLFIQHHRPSNAHPNRPSNCKDDIQQILVTI